MDLLNELLLFASEVTEPERYNSSFNIDDTRTIIGLVMLAIFMVISTLSGVSGNNIMLPICLIFFKFDPKVAVAHTSLLATLSCGVRIIYEKLQTKSVTEDTELINYHLVLMGTAPAVLGSFIGVQANIVSPILIIVIFTTLLQIFLFVYSIRTYLKKKAEEDRKHLKEISPELDEDIYRQSVEKESGDKTTGTDGDDRATEPSLLTDLVPKDEKEVTTEIDILEPVADSCNQYKTTWGDLLIMASLMLLNPLISTIRASKEGKWYQSTRCTVADTVVLLVYAGLLVLLTILLSKNVLTRNLKKRLSKKDISLKEPSYCVKFALGIVGVSFVGGFLAAGSSTLLSIFMISLEIYPFIASSTTMVLAVIFSGSSTILYALNGLIYIKCVLIAGTVVLVTTIITRMTLYQSFLKHGKASLILLFIAITMLVTIPSNIVQVYPHIKEDYDAGKNIWALNDYCP